MSRKLKFAVNEYYHVYNRGVEKRIIYNNEFDFQRFLLLLVLVNDTKPVEVQQLVRSYTVPELLKQTRDPLVKVLAFSLMPNHYHLILKEITEKGISRFMHKVGTGYSLYFNLQNDRSGSLFQGTYQAKHIADDRYLKYMFEYIHLNPVRSALDKGQLVTKNLLTTIMQNPYTSLRVYAGQEKSRIAESVLDQAEFSRIFSSFEEHRTRLGQWNEASKKPL
ncbi:MAG TPA: transposase [Candidatus Paceibacterota bacterium]|nr:transposase [Candidatus Paceibacterota bacterium]HMO83255.1 transposase [Candidatus Paceibacterota bacterium]